MNQFQLREMERDISDKRFRIICCLQDVNNAIASAQPQLKELHIWFSHQKQMFDGDHARQINPLVQNHATFSGIAR